MDKEFEKLQVEAYTRGKVGIADDEIKIKLEQITPAEMAGLDSALKNFTHAEVIVKSSDGSPENTFITIKAGDGQHIKEIDDSLQKLGNPYKELTDHAKELVNAAFPSSDPLHKSPESIKPYRELVDAIVDHKVKTPADLDKLFESQKTKEPVHKEFHNGANFAAIMDQLRNDKDGISELDLKALNAISGILNKNGVDHTVSKDELMGLMPKETPAQIKEQIKHTKFER